jgi:hypothetical protein
MNRSRISQARYRAWRIRSLVSLAIFALALATIPMAAFGQAIDIPAIVNADPKAPPTFAMVQYGHQFKADVEDPGTEIERDNAMFGLGHRFNLGEGTNLFTMASYTLHGYDFSGNGGPPGPGNGNKYQWDDVHRLVLAALVGHELTDEWRLLAGPLVRSHGEGGAEFGDTLTGGVILGFDYHPDPDFSIGLLLGVFSNLEDSVGILPVPVMNWSFAEDWKLETGLVSVFDPGVGAQLSWKVAETVAIGTGFSFQNRRYRLKDSTRATNTNRPNRTDDGGIGRESSIPIFGLLRWQPNKRSAVDVLGGVAVGGSLRVEDEKGRRIADDSYDPAPFLGLKANFFF